MVRQAGAAYLARYGAAMPPSHRRALHDLVACRTAELGGHVTQCEACGAEHYVYHSCRNRSCPTCHGAATRAWSVAREAELLPVPYFHVVFTLPAELRVVVRSHQRLLLGLLMTTAAESLQALARDPHYVGGTLGILAVLHTWTRALVYHPHVHCLVPGGGIASDGVGWRAARGNFLVPVRALSVHFRARFLARLTAALPDVVVPPAVWRKAWVVYCKPTVKGSAPVLHYLARYVHRVAITDRRILAVDADRVTFRYRGEQRGEQRHGWRTMTLPAAEFLRRFLQHVLPRGFHKVRYYGFWRPSAARVRARLREQLSAGTPLEPQSSAGENARESAQTPAACAPCDDSLESHSYRSLRRRCPDCASGELRIIRRLPRARSRSCSVSHSAIPP
ncbi:MAG TPA: IS91 family transposase [Gemmatimonadaceae bacterium]|nr:IS91 family transposase [Gemmatimonadaceae bacterium]